MLALCAGLSANVEAWDSSIQNYRPLLNLLRVSPRDTRSLLGCPSVEVSELLSEERISADCAYGLDPLSAFDDAAWHAITTGWELDEFFDRLRTREERQGELARLEQLFSADSARLRSEKETVMLDWLADPHARRRRWRGWWV